MTKPTTKNNITDEAAKRIAVTPLPSDDPEVTGAGPVTAVDEGRAAPGVDDVDEGQPVGRAPGVDDIDEGQPVGRNKDVAP